MCTHVAARRLCLPVPGVPVPGLQGLPPKPGARALGLLLGNGGSVSSTAGSAFRGSEVCFDDALGDVKAGGKGSGNRFFACHPHGRSLSQSQLLPFPRRVEVQAFSPWVFVQTHPRSIGCKGSRQDAGFPLMKVLFRLSGAASFMRLGKPSESLVSLGEILEVVGHCNYLIDPTLRTAPLRL